VGDIRFVLQRLLDAKSGINTAKTRHDGIAHRGVHRLGRTHYHRDVVVEGVADGPSHDGRLSLGLAFAPAPAAGASRGRARAAAARVHVSYARGEALWAGGERVDRPVTQTRM